MPNLADFCDYIHVEPDDRMAELCYRAACQAALDAGIPAWRFYAMNGEGDPKLNQWVYSYAGSEYDNREAEFQSEASANTFIRYQGIRRRELMSPVSAPTGAVLFEYDISDPLLDLADLAGRRADAEEDD